MRRWLVVGVLAIGGCLPVSATRIGPPRPARDAGCEVEFVTAGEPTRPYRDVGGLTVQNCQDWQAAPCREWIREAACGLGGEVVYQLADQRPTALVASEAMTVRVIVAAWAGSPANASGSGCEEPVEARPTAGRCEDE